MTTVTLQRIESSDHGTVGRLKGPDFSLWAMEPPWRDNRIGRSCIPEGVYECVWHRSPRYGWVYLVTAVRGRSHILIHAGNVGGDESLGFKTHTLGCILPGERRGSVRLERPQEAVLVSRPALRRFNAALGMRPFTLEVFS